MNYFFRKIRVGILNDHFHLLGGGTVHSFKFIEYLKKYYDCDVYIPGNPRSPEWMENFLALDVKGVNFFKPDRDAGKKYPYMFFNISHWKAMESTAYKRFMLVFFPQFFFPLYDYDFLANSEYTKKQIIKRWKQPAKKIHVVYPPIMTEKFKPAKEKKNYIIHVSRLNKPRPEADKGHKQMIEAFKSLIDNGLKDWTFHIVGQEGEADYMEQIKAMAAGYPIVFHISAVFPILQKLYAESKIYWHLTGITMPHEAGAQEHFGMTTVEAMSSGCVPITLGTGGQLEVVEDGVNGFLVKSVRELEERTLELVKRPQTMEKMAKEAIKRSKDFDEAISEKKFWSVVARTDKISIIILCWNNAQYTKECVERLYEVTPPGFELILVDNASEDNTRPVIEELAKKYEGIKLVFNKTNVGFAKGNNIGLEQATRDYVCYLNNDTLPQWGWLERMVDVLEMNEDAGIVGARLYSPKKGKDWHIQHMGVNFKSGYPLHTNRGKKDTEIGEAGIQEVEAVTAACMLVRKKLAKFNEDFIRGYYEDTDLCLRVREQGYKIYINHEARLIHYEGVSQDILKKKDLDQFNEITQKNKKLFMELWGEKMKKLPKISKKIDTIGISQQDIKVEIGGGETPLHPDYIQIDLRQLPGIKHIKDARVLPFASNSVSHLCSCYMLQCLDETGALEALREWYRCLRPGGKLELYVPDLDQVMRMFISTKDKQYLDEIYGAQSHELDYYRTGWVFETLEALVSKAYFVRLEKIPTPKHRPYALSIVAYKSI